jgi:transposase
MRYEFSDDERTAIAPILPNKPRGVRWVDDRRVLDGISWVCVQARHGMTCQRPMVPARLLRIASLGG